MLTVQQTDIMALLNDFKCLRYAHIKKYIAAKHNSSDEQLSIMLKQLIFLGMLKKDAGLVMLPGRRMNAETIKAFDALMNMTEGEAEFISPGPAPFILTFSVKTDSKPTAYDNYGVLIAEMCCENSICGRLGNIDRDMTVIFILKDIRQKNLLKIANKSYFVIQDENGKYRYFSGYRKDARTP